MDSLKIHWSNRFRPMHLKYHFYLPPCVMFHVNTKKEKKKLKKNHRKKIIKPFLFARKPKYTRASYVSGNALDRFDESNDERDSLFSDQRFFGRHEPRHATRRGIPVVNTFITRARMLKIKISSGARGGGVVTPLRDFLRCLG
jgi:hypothetical protein